MVLFYNLIAGRQKCCDGLQSAFQPVRLPTRYNRHDQADQRRRSGLYGSPDLAEVATPRVRTGQCRVELLRRTGEKQTPTQSVSGSRRKNWAYLARSVTSFTIPPSKKNTSFEEKSAADQCRECAIKRKHYNYLTVMYWLECQLYRNFPSISLSQLVASSCPSRRL